jgi:Winged helix-turn helix
LAREDSRHAISGQITRGLFGEKLRGLARRSKDVNQSRRLRSLAGVRDGMDRGAAARIGGMDRQTLRDWVHRFNASGPEGLLDNRTEGPKPRLSAEQVAEFAQIVEAARSARKTASWAGGVSILSASSPSGSASTSTSARSGRF